MSSKRNRERLEGMQGPEQGLVGESRSGSPTGPAEEAKPGERGVGKIAVASELLAHIDRIISQVRRRKSSFWNQTVIKQLDLGIQEAALVALREEVERICDKRSDLPNAEVSHGDGNATSTPEKS